MKPKTYSIDGVTYVRARAIEQEARLIAKITASMDQDDENVQQLCMAAARLLYGPVLDEGKGRGYPMTWHFGVDHFRRLRVDGKGHILIPEPVYQGDVPEVGDTVYYNGPIYVVTAIERQGKQWSLVVRPKMSTALANSWR